MAIQVIIHKCPYKAVSGFRIADFKFSCCPDFEPSSGDIKENCTHMYTIEPIPFCVHANPTELFEYSMSDEEVSKRIKKRIKSK
jgi:Fe-S-cluster-containing dehydrogenase component